MSKSPREYFRKWMREAIRIALALLAIVGATVLTALVTQDLLVTLLIAALAVYIGYLCDIVRLFTRASAYWYLYQSSRRWWQHVNSVCAVLMRSAVKAGCPKSSEGGNERFGDLYKHSLLEDLESEGVEATAAA